MENLVLSEFPNARVGQEVTDTYLNFLKTEHGADLDKMLFATSLCSDDVNVSTDFRKVLRRPFTMGGLGGLPFAGFTGMVAFGHHIPDNGDAFILYGPHIGITEEGELGRMRRPGQAKYSNSCGALMLALERLQDSDNVYVPVSSELDYQQTLLERSVMPFKQRIISSDNPQKEITEVIYEVISDKIHRLVVAAREEFHCDRVFLLGGIIINTSPEFHDYCDVRHFEVFDLKSANVKAPRSILDTEAFKNL